MQTRFLENVILDLTPIQPGTDVSGFRPDQVFVPRRLTILLPNKDVDGSDINVAFWINATAQLLAHKFGGVSVSSAYQGFWLNPDSNELIEETTFQVSVFADPDDLLRHGSSVNNHIRRFGRETNQGEVLVRLDDKILRYTRFDCASLPPASETIQ